jgi:hypothetical protein
MAVAALALNTGMAAAPVSAQTAAAPVAAPAAAHGEVKKDKSVKMDKSAPAGKPDAALLDYLGRYGDAADGLDPLGLGEADTGAAGDGVPPRKERQ